MPFRATKPSRALGGAACALALALSAGPGHAQPGPFAGLSGSWSGGGVITLASGASERIRCRATYAVPGDGSNLQLNLRCASDSYNFDLRSNVTYQGGALSGAWSETTRNVSGNLSGRVNAGQIQARVDGPGFSAGLSLATQGNRQSVTIRAPGTELVQVSVALTRGSR